MPPRVGAHRPNRARFVWPRYRCALAEAVLPPALPRWTRGASLDQRRLTRSL